MNYAIRRDVRVTSEMRPTTDKSDSVQPAVAPPKKAPVICRGFSLCLTTGLG